MSDRKSVTFEDEQAAIVESLARESSSTTDVPPISQAEAIRYLVDTGVETIADEISVEGVDEHTAEVLRELIPRHAIVDWKRDKIKGEAREADLRGGWRGRVKRDFSNRLAGEAGESYHPDDMRALAPSYVAEARMYWDDPDRIAEQVGYVEALLERYEEAYHDAEVTPDDDPFEWHDDVRRGRDIQRLRGQIEKVVDDIVEIAEATAFDVDAIIDRLCADYQVEEETIEYLIEVLSDEDEDPRRMLKSNTEEEIRERIDPNYDKLANGRRDDVAGVLEEIGEDVEEIQVNQGGESKTMTVANLNPTESDNTATDGGGGDD